MNVLVTGGAGFIGSHLVDALVERGDRVRVLDNLASGTPPAWNRPSEVEFLRGDIRDPETVRRAAWGTEAIFHLAALPSVQGSIQDPFSCHDVNVTGTLQVLLAARDAGVRRVVFSSSSAIYGDSPEMPKREDMSPCVLSPYASAKLTGEHYLQHFTQLYGLETVALRYFNVFGPRQNPKSEYAAAIPRFVSRILAGEAPVVFGDGEQTRDFVAVQNVVQANLLAASAPAANGRVYNIGCGTSISLNELIRQIGSLVGRCVEPEYLPARTGDVRHSLASIEAARRDLGYEPRVRTEAGLAALIEDMRSRGRSA